MFNTTKLAGNRTLVSGTDQFGITNKAVIDSTEWEAIKAESDHKNAHQEFDAAVEAFYAPLTEAMEAIEELHKAPAIDPLFQVVLNEGTEGTAGEAKVVRHLSKDSAILRLLEQDANTTRLVWVGDDLEITAEDVAAPTTVAFVQNEGFGVVGTEPTA
jgi:hypothetical protein